MEDARSKKFKQYYVIYEMFQFSFYFPKDIEILGCGQAGSVLWGEGASLALVGHPSSDVVTIKIPNGTDILLHWPASHSIFSYWVG